MLVRKLAPLVVVALGALGSLGSLGCKADPNIVGGAVRAGLGEEQDVVDEICGTEVNKVTFGDVTAKDCQADAIPMFGERIAKGTCAVELKARKKVEGKSLGGASVTCEGKVSFQWTSEGEMVKTGKKYSTSAKYFAFGFRKVD